MNSRLAAAALALTTALLTASGCASTETAGTPQAAERPEPVYRTGSNIRLRDKKPMTKEEKERQAEDSSRWLQEMQEMQGLGNPAKTN